METAISSLKLSSKRHSKREIFSSEANYQRMSFSCMAPHYSFCSFTVQDLQVAKDAVSWRKKIYIYSPMVPNNRDEKSGEEKNKG